VYAWYGAVGTIPAGFVVLLPTAIPAGAALAMGNQLADLAHDRVSGTPSTVRLLGAQASWALMAALYVGVLLVALGSLWLLRGAGAGVVVAVAGAASVIVGVLTARPGDGRGLRARAWELQAAGIGLLAAGWIAALTGTPALSG
jgi:4-hydroxybenzoate polyprenyltransferase